MNSDMAQGRGPNEIARVSYEPLTPTAFLERTAGVSGKRTAYLDGQSEWSYEDLDSRSRSLAGALRATGAGPGSRVAVLAPNTHVLLEAHYGVPLARCVLVALNTRLSSRELAYILDHSGADILIYDHELEDLARAAAPEQGLIRTVRAGGIRDEYEAWLGGAPQISEQPEDEQDLLALNYTSGTTGLPKGVMYHHRGAYLQALAMVFHARLRPGDVFLWTLPMFHCNGWCFTWAVTAAGGVHRGLRQVDPEVIWNALRTGGATHLAAAPTVLISLVNHPAAKEGPLVQPVHVCTGGAPPSPALLGRLADLNIELTHLYGLTETFGPSVVCDWHPEWDELDPAERARLKARQGVANLVAQPVRLINESGGDVPANGRTLGEVGLRGNTVMLGYYDDPKGTAAVTRGDWFMTGDVGVMHPDGYIELKDRKKDVIISGGENVSSVEVEQAIMSHPGVLEAAVVAVPDEKWGERPVAYVSMKPGAEATAQEIREHVRERLAAYKAPDQVEFRDVLPKTGTGKVQKHRLREEAG